MVGDAFKALGDPTRRRILELLSEGEMSAGDIAAHFDMAKPSVSHHLNILKNAGLVTDERRGQNIVLSVFLRSAQNQVPSSLSQDAESVRKSPDAPVLCDSVSPRRQKNRQSVPHNR